ncbi:MBL fold metallo-hydrolase [Collinsella tanakaei]|uniref:MBL fold metallo-hydrolase n=1 Tax=Collinsella TaxID=102106 RepID=UPI0019567566|nr:MULTISPECIES: MBL fold metallo-hydrolase [Collinsella]MBM6785746.1 MBL fold metallo-hydrolase [Collinsella tanakaei]MDM8300330.1 MBL fold metallo-hydrolase [Collinsella tanakaei]MDN0054617.1 MBL fold metallo-hydrolase [Collinsella ihumii]
MSDYVESVQSEALRIRWISVQCYEMVLPNGKTIVTDPFYWEGDNLRVLPELTKQQANSLKVYAQEGFSVDDFTGADYILISHVHGDHMNIAGDLWNKFYGRVLVPAGAAEELARVEDIPYGAIMPLYPGNTYYLDDFTLTVYPGAHDNRAFREGAFMRPSSPETPYAASDDFAIPCPNRLNGLGTMFCFNFLIETPQNYRIDFSAGRDYPDHVRHVRDKAPNLMLRHRIRSYTPEEYARQMEAMGAQLMMPLHHNNARAKGEDLNEYFGRVNGVLKADGYPGVAFNPKPYQWYSITTGISAQ